MDRARAAAIAEEYVSRLSARPFVELRALVDEGEQHQEEGIAGRTFTVDVEAFWELSPGGNLRVIVSVDGGGLSAWNPVTRHFVMSPSGALVEDA